ncbi:hypothetical protein BGX21_007445, partial [Mortierella sp. AD011]
KDVIDEVVLKYADPIVDSKSHDVMPLQDRDVAKAVGVVKNNVRENIKGSTSKANFHMLVSGGAPGIGKTRFGQELFGHLRDDWITPTFNDNR